MEMKLKAISQSETEEMKRLSATFINENDENVTYVLTIRGNDAHVSSLLKQYNIIDFGDELLVSFSKNPQRRIGDTNE